jgi:hypothetical protein
MTEYRITYWQDIPSMVSAKAGRQRAKVELAPRFAVAIDELAMRLGITGSDDYLQAWRRSPWEAREGAPEEVAAAVAAELEAAYPPERVRALLDAATEQ